MNASVDGFTFLAILNAKPFVLMPLGLFQALDLTPMVEGERSDQGLLRKPQFLLDELLESNHPPRICLRHRSIYLVPFLHLMSQVDIDVTLNVIIATLIRFISNIKSTHEKPSSPTL